MAKLSERIVKVDIKLFHPPNGFKWTLEGESYEDYRRVGWSDEGLIDYGYLKPRNTKPEQIEELLTYTQKGETNMTNTLRTLNLTLLDLSPELKGDDKVVYEEQGIRTEYNDEQTIQNLLATGDVLSALKIHNDNIRVKTLDHQYKGSAREVFLEAIDHLGDNRLKWEVVRVG